LNVSTVSLEGGNFLIDGGDGNDTIKGSVLADRIRGGAGVDLLTGGNGADTFQFGTLSHGLWNGGSTFERITDFVVGEDALDVSTVPDAITMLGTATALTSTAISSLLNSTAFAAHAVASFNFGTAATARTFIAFNDDVAGFNRCTDGLVEITGFSFAAGSTSLAQITLV
jgi:Ca2+-binding RTX toxin-like protein